MKNTVRKLLRSLYRALVRNQLLAQPLLRLRSMLRQLTRLRREPCTVFELATTNNFNETGYLAANPDVSQAVAAKKTGSAAEHLASAGNQEGRLQKSEVRLTRNERVMYAIKRDGAGLEIGPSFNPLMPKKKGFNVKSLDHATREELVQKYAGHGVNISAIEEVDYVWRGEPLHELVGDDRFDFVLASHVIEHSTDMIRFLQQLAAMLRPEGVISLIIPDKRYCFDYFRFPASTGDILQAYAEARTRHPPGVIFDHMANVVTLGSACSWTHERPGSLQLVHTLDEAVASFKHAGNTTEYLDAHCWRFTPASFRLILNDLRALGFIDLYEVASFDTIGEEFFVSLRRSEGKVQKILPRGELMQAMMDEQAAVTRRMAQA
jgi:predicted SAM-dependent methyltransferase